MAEHKRDFLDDIIDVSQDLKAIGNPLTQLANTLAAEPSKEPVWNPADYKIRPRANTIPCTTCRSKDQKTCERCVAVCPVDAITLDENAIEMADSCIKCGLCVEACPSECFSVRDISPRVLYDRIASAAMSHESAYVSCTRALGRLPKNNEIVLPCVGVVPAEVWAAIMADYANVSVYLPLGICDDCRTTTGEETYTNAIGLAESWCGFGLGLEVEENELTHEVRRSWQRKEFVDNIVHSGERLLSRTSPVMSAARRVTQQIQAHRSQLDRLTRALDQAVGTTNAKRQRRVLLERRRILMGMLQKHPALAKNVDLVEPRRDPDLCQLCGACEKACPTRAIELSAEGHWSVEAAFCAQCGACFHVCPTQALAPCSCDASELVFPDQEAQDRAAQEKARKAEVEKLKQEGLQRLNQGLDFLERLDTGTSNSSS